MTTLARRPPCLSGESPGFFCVNPVASVPIRSINPLGLSAGDSNFYRYASNDPVNGSDPGGFIKLIFDNLPGTNRQVIFSQNGDTPEAFVGYYDPATGTVDRYGNSRKIDAVKDEENNFGPDTPEEWNDFFRPIAATSIDPDEDLQAGHSQTGAGNGTQLEAIRQFNDLVAGLGITVAYGLAENYIPIPGAKVVSVVCKKIGNGGRAVIKYVRKGKTAGKIAGEIVETTTLDEAATRKLQHEMEDALSNGKGKSSGKEPKSAGCPQADGTGTPPASAKGVAPNSGGGPYDKVRAGNTGGQVHHTPAAKVTPFEYRKAPSVWMETADHRKTASWGSSKTAEAYRSKQDALINSGKLREAIQMDIDDIRSLFGNKYDANIKQMVESFGISE